ncbi:MAG: hypothetical protein ACLSG5_06865 [Oscillospiraceae bacterium]
MHKSLLSERRGLAIFSEKALMIAAALISLLLQIISFVTTWQGAEAYFSSAFPLAPLLFAVAVQSVVYFTSNSIRRKPGAGKIIALALALLCSNYFSFVGIYKPLIRRRFTSADSNAYSAELTAAAEERLRAKARSTGDIDAAVNAVISRYSELTSQKAAMDKLTEQLAEISGTV